MKISCTQENLNQGLNIVSHIANKNSNLPILGNILIRVEDKILNLSTTNLEIGIRVDIRSKVESEGDFTVDAKLFSDYISLLPKERIDLELVGDELKINCQKQKTKIKTQPAGDFPLIPQIKKEDPYIIKAKTFKKAISEVVFAVAISETRPEISGVYMKFIDDVVVLAATDSYRLCEKKVKIEKSNKEEKEIIIPVKTLQEVSRILGVFKEDAAIEDIENIEIYISNNQIMFSYNGVDLVSRLIEGQYPDYTQILPTEHKTKVNINKENIVKAVKTSSLFTKSGIYDVKLEFSATNNSIIISSSSAQTGENVSEVEAEISGEENNIVLNYKYLLDGLQNIDSENVVFELNTGNNPCVLRPSENSDYVYIIMPIKQ